MSEFLVTTLDENGRLTDYLDEHGIRVRYPSDIDFVERVEIIRDLRLVNSDVGRHQLITWGDLFQRFLFVAILDADKEGLRSERSLIQTIGRART